MNSNKVTWVVVNGAFMGALYLATFQGAQAMGWLLSLLIFFVSAVVILAYHSITNIKSEDHYRDVMNLKRNYQDRVELGSSVPKTIDFLYDVTAVAIMISFGWYFTVGAYILFCVYQQSLLNETSQAHKKPSIMLGFLLVGKYKNDTQLRKS